MTSPVTEAGYRLLWMYETKRLDDGRWWPRSVDARLVERIAEEFIPRIESEAVERALGHLHHVVEGLPEGEAIPRETVLAMLRPEPVT